ncbi:hypothetical protein LZ32DRAFT_615552 [Colletotrichum eremochloae]|nr:hypothetical protein LZ32DRAFT_615552 [Colletotrichum eremochloae]
MDEFCVRLLSFFDRGTDGKPGRWPHPALSPEDMAGAGFRLQGSQLKPGDNVICDFCRLQAWKWETKDDPFHQHQDASPNCEYVTSDLFKEHHDVFVRKQQLEVKEIDQRPLTPPATPTKRSYKPRRRMALSQIVTVYESAPTHQATQGSLNLQEQSKMATEVSVTAGSVDVVIRVYEHGDRGPALAEYTSTIVSYNQHHEHTLLRSSSELHHTARNYVHANDSFKGSYARQLEGYETYERTVKRGNELLE